MCYIEEYFYVKLKKEKIEKNFHVKFSHVINSSLQIPNRIFQYEK